MKTKLYLLAACLITLVAGALVYTTVSQISVPIRHEKKSSPYRTPALDVLTVPSQLRIMPLGDSITVGEGANGDGWRLPLASLLVDVQQWPAEWVGSQTSGNQPNPRHEGHSGWRIDQLAGQVTDWLTTWTPDVVIVQAGTNDALQGSTAEVMMQRMSTLVATIRQARPSAHILLGELIPVRYGTDRDIASVAMQQFNATLPTLVGDHVALARLSLVPNRLLVGGLHPGPKGYERMGWIYYRCLGMMTGNTIRQGENPLPVSIPDTELCVL